MGLLVSDPAPGAVAAGTCWRRQRGQGDAGLCEHRLAQNRALRPFGPLTLFLLGWNDSCRALDIFNPVFMDEIL